MLYVFCVLGKETFCTFLCLVVSAVSTAVDFSRITVLNLKKLKKFFQLYLGIFEKKVIALRLQKVQFFERCLRDGSTNRDNDDDDDNGGTTSGYCFDWKFNGF